MISGFLTTAQRRYLKILAMAGVLTFLIVACGTIQFVNTKAARILPLGDSITSGDTSHDSYRRPLWKMLDSAAYEVDFVGSTRMNFGGPPPDTDFDRDNEGHYGWRADRIADSLPSWLALYTPDIVLLHIGTNDMAQGRTVEQTLGSILDIVHILRNSNPRVVVLLALLIPNPYGVDSLNVALPHFAEMQTTSVSPVIIVDQNSGFYSGLDSYDGAHPNASGELKMAQKWYDALVPFLNKQGG